MTTNAPAPISGDSCPTGITFGETVTLSPSGETVTNPKTAYFNNGDYVVIWTEIKVTPPRLEFQLFNGTDNTKIACTTTPSCTGELIESLGTKRLGTSAVGVYEDYRFIIAWSTQENSYSPWVINIKSFNYNVVDSSYQTTTFTKTIPNTQNHGIFGFATLSLDNGFVLSYMETAYKLITHIYKEKDNYQPQSLPSPEPVKASYKKEILIKAVPTQYFFSVVVSDLMDNRGIYIRNYRIDDGTKVCPVISTESDQCLDPAYLNEPITPKPCYHYISSNPRGIFADLSYGGTLTVAWRDKEKDLDKQRNIRYKVQMFSDTASIGQPFEISDKNDNSQNYDTYLRQVITQSQSRVIATFLKQETSNNRYIVKIFDNNGIEVVPSRSTSAQTSITSGARTFKEMSVISACVPTTNFDLIVNSAAAQAIPASATFRDLCLVHNSYSYCDYTSRTLTAEVLKPIDSILHHYQKYIGEDFVRLQTDPNKIDIIFKKYFYLFVEIGIVKLEYITHIIDKLANYNSFFITHVRYWPFGCSSSEKVYIQISQDIYNVWLCSGLNNVVDIPRPEIIGYYNNKLSYIAKAFYFLSTAGTYNPPLMRYTPSVEDCQSYLYSYLRKNLYPYDGGIDCLNYALSVVYASNNCNGNTCSFEQSDDTKISAIGSNIVSIVSKAKNILDGDNLSNRDFKRHS